MSELFQMFFISNPGLFLLLGAVAVALLAIIPIYFMVFNARVNKLSYRRAIHAIGFALMLGIMLYGTNVLFGIIRSATEHMSECETSTISIRVDELGMESERDITVCRDRVDWDSEEFTVYGMQTEQSTTSQDRIRQVDRCMDVNVDLYVNNDKLVAVNDTMSIQLCIKYGELSSTKLEEAINGTPSK